MTKLDKKTLEEKSESRRKQPEGLKANLLSLLTGQKSPIYFLLVLVLIALGSAGYFWFEASAFKKDPQKSAQLETQKLLAKVSTLIVLPEDETPTVATVTDPDKIKNQAFFAKAKIGDKVLIYTSAKKAILYDPVANKIVEVAPINIGETPLVPPPAKP